MCTQLSETNPKIQCMTAIHQLQSCGRSELKKFRVRTI